MRYLFSFLLFTFIYSNSQAQETFINYHKNGNVLEKGKRINGKFEGEFLSFYENGLPKSVAKYISGFIVEKKVYNTIGKIIESSYMINGTDSLQVYKYDDNRNIVEEGVVNSMGLKIGEWLYYDENNTNYKTIFYKDGQEVNSH